ncbi:unnamed protein product [Periconia digitata]|uniref:Secreted protein n=1 Tax=Periconia digitata TaxID=1303443 RepID=A0A9W4U2L9_9PLEO|nr:unnamed protein product [Periconia digitata]
MRPWPSLLHVLLVGHKQVHLMATWSQLLRGRTDGPKDTQTHEYKYIDSTDTHSVYICMHVRMYVVEGNSSTYIAALHVAVPPSNNTRCSHVRGWPPPPWLTHDPLIAPRMNLTAPSVLHCILFLTLLYSPSSLCRDPTSNTLHHYIYNAKVIMFCQTPSTSPLPNHATRRPANDCNTRHRHQKKGYRT